MSPLGLPSEIIGAQLEWWRQQFAAGDRSALIAAIRFCFEEEVIAPAWVGAAFIRATDDWWFGRAKEFGKAFGLDMPKGKHLAASRKKQMLKWEVFTAIIKAPSEQPRDDLLFAEVGKRFGLGTTLVKEYYAAVRARQKQGVSPVVAFLLPDGE